jgi:hypothetical protein
MEANTHMNHAAPTGSATAELCPVHGGAAAALGGAVRVSLPILGNFPISTESNMNNAIVFNAEDYATRLREFGNSLRTTDGKSDRYSQTALAALITGSLTPLALAITVYSEMEPTKGNGKPAEPKESDKAAGGVSVSSLRTAKGGEGAKATLEAIFYILDNREHDSEAVSDFVLGKRGAFKLFPLKRHLQAEKAKAARAEAEGATGGADAAEPKEGMDKPEVPSVLADALAYIEALDGEALTAEADAIELLLTACREASERLAAAEQLTGTNG